MTARRLLPTLVGLLVLAALGAAVALAGPTATDRPVLASPRVVAIVQAPATRPAAAATPPSAPAVDRSAIAAAHRVAPGADVRVHVVAGPLAARAAVARAATGADVLVGTGSDVRAALAEARTTWPGLRTVALR